MLRTSQAFPDLGAQLVPVPFTLKVDPTLQDRNTDGYVGEILAIDLHAYTPAFIIGPRRWRGAATSACPGTTR